MKCAWQIYRRNERQQPSPNTPFSPAIRTDIVRARSIPETRRGRVFWSGSGSDKDAAAGLVPATLEL